MNEKGVILLRKSLCYSQLRTDGGGGEELEKPLAWCLVELG